MRPAAIFRSWLPRIIIFGAGFFIPLALLTKYYKNTNSMRKELPIVQKISTLFKTETVNLPKRETVDRSSVKTTSTTVPAITVKSTTTVPVTVKPATTTTTVPLTKSSTTGVKITTTTLIPAKTQSLDPKISKAISEIREKEKYLAETLYNEEKIVCMILTTNKSIARQTAIINTWGKRCQFLLFFIGGNSTESRKINSFAEMVTVEMEDRWDSTWIKVRLAIAYINEHFNGKFDWFLRADDDTYVIMENLRLFLKARDRTAPEMYGVHYKLYGEYIGTGASLTVSALNFNKMVNHMNHTLCSKGRTHDDDVEISNCLKLAGVKVADSRDDKNRFRFFPFNAETTLNRKLIPAWVWGWSKFNMTDGFDCCADDYIGFHYVAPEKMRALEFLIYYSHPFSVRESWQRPQPK